MSATTINTNNSIHDNNAVYGSLPVDIAQVTPTRSPYATRSRIDNLNVAHLHHHASTSSSQKNNIYSSRPDESHFDPNLPTNAVSSHSSGMMVHSRTPPHDETSYDMRASFQPQAHDFSVPASQDPGSSHNEFDMLHPVVATHPSFFPQPSPPLAPRLIPRPDLPPPPAPIEPNTTGEFDMAPPPESLHPSFTALHSYAQEYAAEHGYALSINTTAKNRSRIKLACVCYGAPKNTHKLTAETRIRKNRQSSKTGCKMWIEGKKHEDDGWVLKVGEPRHNHEGRPVEGWAVQRKRTWGVENGRIGVGGVTAREERERVESQQKAADGMFELQQSSNGHDQSQSESARNQDPNDEPQYDHDESSTLPRDGGTPHGLENGGRVWRIVEQEMLKKGGPGQGRDRGVGRTVKVLQEKLPGIRIFKRDVYNIRAQIKRARKQAGQEVGEGLDHEEETEMLDLRPSSASKQASNPVNTTRYPEIDPLLVAQCNDALRNVSAQQQQESEVLSLRSEVENLRAQLEQQRKELEERNEECQRLKMENDLLKIQALYHPRNDA